MSPEGSSKTGLARGIQARSPATSRAMRAQFLFDYLAENGFKDLGDTLQRSFSCAVEDIGRESPADHDAELKLSLETLLASKLEPARGPDLEARAFHAVTADPDQESWQRENGEDRDTHPTGSGTASTRQMTDEKSVALQHPAVILQTIATQDEVRSKTLLNELDGHTARLVQYLRLG